MPTNPSRRNGVHLKQSKSEPIPARLAAEAGNVELTTPGFWMTYAEVCQLFGESRHTLNKWRKRTELEFPVALVKPNGQLMFRRAEVAAFISRLAVAA